MKNKDAIIFVVGITLPRCRNKEESIAIARISRAGKVIAKISTAGTAVDGSNLVDVADAIEALLSTIKRARASAHNEDSGESP